MAEFKHILVPTDFGESSRAALEVAVELVNKYGATLTLLHACENPLHSYPGMAYAPAEVLSATEEHAQKECDAAVKALRARVPEARGVLRFGPPAHEIQKVIDETQVDLVVRGTHGRRGLGHVLLGSVAEKTVRLSPVPVLTVRGSKTASHDVIFSPKEQYIF
ncbi:MAG TPA: universal stress protein [Polyangiaceae bacterium]